MERGNSNFKKRRRNCENGNVPQISRKDLQIEIDAFLKNGGKVKKVKSPSEEEERLMHNLMINV